MNPLFSFIVPVYKKSPEIFRATLKSLFDQSLRQIEVLCVFDGPDDDLQKVLVEFPKVKVLIVPHGGACRARNMGIDMAIGKYVVAWDADCLIKPDASRRWLDEFKATNADFVYTGYELSNEKGAFDSEPFDRYSLECGNFICSMSPVLREKAPRWDETLESAQDWDYWLTATENGLKGVFIEGSAFVTEAPDANSISIKGLCGPNHDDIVKQIRHKHWVPEREIGVFSAMYRAMGIKLAKILNADFIKPQGYSPTVYKTILNFGYSQMSRFEGIPDTTTKIQYWLPGEIEGLKTRNYLTVMETIRIAKKVVNFCNTQYECNKLAELGINAEVVSLPLAKEDYQKVSSSLPSEFTVLVATDKAYSELLKDLAIDLPHINFKFNAAKIEDFSCFVSFYQFAALDNAMLMALVNGRNVISNVQAPYCGFIDPDQSWEKFKSELYERFREVKSKPFNKHAQDFYLNLADPESFRDRILAYSVPKVEVIA